MIRKDDLIDVPERRAISWNEFEIRTEGNTLKFEGYASIFDKGYDVAGGPTLGGWTETVTRSAFKRTLTDKPDVVLLLNHEGLPLARTKSGTLQLSTDSTGLLSRSDLDLRDPDVKGIAIKMERGDLSEMSFAFRVKQNTWSDDETQRALDEVSLHKGDVSIVTFGANPYTSATLRSVFTLLANGELQEEQMAELRAMSDQVDRAVARLRGTRADDEPYGDVDYADPGYQKDGQKRYPLSSAEKVRAAWSYINVPKNAEEYNSEQLAHIKGKIKAAAEKFGVEISDGESNTSSHDDIIHAIATALGDQRALSDGAGFEDGNDDDSYHGGDSLAQAVHDLVADAVGCVAPTGTTQLPDDAPYGARGNLTVAGATRAAQNPGNLSVAAAARMCRPDDSPDPLSIDAAMRLAS